MKGIEQRPTPPNEWLYMEDNNGRTFYDVAYLPIGSPMLLECTNAEKAAWEEAHKEEEPIEAEEV